jgi:hypothetical protein
MAATKATLVQAGFDPSFIDKLISHLGAAVQPVLDEIAKVQSTGFGIAVIVDCVNLSLSFGAAIVTDVLGLLSNPTPVVMTAMAHPTAKMATAAAGSHPFLDWLKANISTLGPFLLQILMTFLKVPAVP